MNLDNSTLILVHAVQGRRKPLGPFRHHRPPLARRLLLAFSSRLLCMPTRSTTCKNSCKRSAHFGGPPSSGHPLCVDTSPNALHQGRTYTSARRAHNKRDCVLKLSQQTYLGRRPINSAHTARRSAHTVARASNAQTVCFAVLA